MPLVGSPLAAYSLPSQLQLPSPSPSWWSPRLPYPGTEAAKQKKKLETFAVSHGTKIGRKTRDIYLQ